MASLTFKVGDEVVLMCDYPAVMGVPGTKGIVRQAPDGDRETVCVYYPHAKCSVQTYVWRLRKANGLFDI